MGRYHFGVEPETLHFTRAEWNCPPEPAALKPGHMKVVEEVEHFWTAGGTGQDDLQSLNFLA